MATVKTQTTPPCSDYLFKPCTIAGEAHCCADSYRGSYAMCNRQKDPLSYSVYGCLDEFNEYCEDTNSQTGVKCVHVVTKVEREVIPF